MPKFFFYFLIILCSFSGVLHAQQTSIGQWRTHFSYNKNFTVEKMNDKIYFGSNHLVEYAATTNEWRTYSKVNGLSDVNITNIRYDENSGFMVLVYENGNIDLFKDQIFYNIPDIKNLNVIGSKQINSIFFKNKLIYICTDFGIVVLNPIRKEIKETYVLQSAGTIATINGLTTQAGKFFAATGKGIFTADENDANLQNFSNWTLINPIVLNDIISINDSIFGINSNTLFSLANQTLNVRYQNPLSTFKRIVKGQSNFYICESNDDIRQISVFDILGQQIDSINQINPYDVVEQNSSTLWVADFWEGSTRLINRHQKEVLKPKGIYDNSVYNLSYGAHDIFVSAGNEAGWILTYTSAGVSRLNLNGDWTWYNRFENTPGLSDVVDILDVAVDERNGTIYGASYVNGLWELRKDNTATNYANTDYIQSFGLSNRIVGLKFDRFSNLWMTNYGADNQLVVKKADNTWQKFSFPYSVTEKTASQIAIDDADQKWVVAPRGVGLFVFNDNGTIDNKNDDQIKFLKNGAGNGNLPSAFVNCVEKDKNGKIWVGTADGIAIFNCAENMFRSGSCDAELKIVKYDVDAGLLFQGENVRTIATDGANNKWIGTNNGVWKISDDAEKILNRFDTKNSPLPSDDINKIIVHPETGEVFIATEKGLISYRSDATDAKATNDDLLVFPNPIPSQYTGTIAIKNLVDNADVRITDVSGQLVYRTKAQGGQATWNGKNYLGERPRTGVYYVFVTNADGTQVKSGKMIFNE